MTRWPDRPRIDLPLAVILIAALLLRLYGLGASSLWTDETIVATQSLRPLPDILTDWPGDLEPPLSYVLVHLTLQFTDDERALRLPSLLAGVLAVWLIYRLGTLLFSRRVGLLAGALLAVSPLDVRYAQDVRYYALFSAFALLCNLAFFTLLERKRGWLAYAGSVLLAVSTHLFAWVIVAIQLWLVLSLALARRTVPRVPLAFPAVERGFAARFILVCCVLGTVFAAVYGPTILARNRAVPSTEQVAASPIKAGAGDNTPGFGPASFVMGVYYRTFKWFAVPSGLSQDRYMNLVGIPPAWRGPFQAIGALAVIGVFGSWRRYRERGALVAAQVVLALTALALLTEWFGPRIGVLRFGVHRMLFLLPLFWLLVAVGLATAGDWLAARLRHRPALNRPRTAAALSWLLATLCCVTVAASLLPGYYAWRKDDWRGLAAYLEQHVAADEAILCCDSIQTALNYEWVPLTFYLRDSPLRSHLTLIKGGPPPASTGDVVWHIRYTDAPFAGLPGYVVTEQTFIGPYWLWVSRLERNPTEPVR